MINQDRLVKTFLELAQIDSPSGEEKVMAGEVKKRLESLGFTVEFDKYGNVIGKIDGEGEPIMINAHLDTVEPGRGIKPIRKGDIIKSDGSTIVGGDQKAGISLILEALTSVSDDNKKHLPINVVFTTSEEVGLLGAKNLDYSRIEAKIGVTFDGPGKVSNITIATPGYAGVDVEIIGRSAHAGAEPEKGISAIKIASEIISKLVLGRIDEETTANIGLIEGGSARNAVAEKVEFKGEIRSRDKAKLDKQINHFKEVFDSAAKNYPQAKIKYEIKKNVDPFNISTNHPLIKNICNVMEQMRIKPNPEASGGISDISIFNSRGIEMVDVGTGIYDMHTTREYVVITELVEAARFCEKLITV